MTKVIFSITLFMMAAFFGYPDFDVFKTSKLT